MTFTPQLPSAMIAYLDKEGNTLSDPLPVPAKDILELYRCMTLARFADKKAITMQRQGRMITYPPQSGQEASAVGAAYALSKDDWIVPSWREMGALLMRGVTLSEILLYWAGFEQGSTTFAKHKMTPLTMPVGTQIPHAVGISWAAKMRGENQATLVFFGDGATSEGDFHEAMNFAGVYKTPTIFFCMNNQWAISIPRKQQTASATIAQKAKAYGFEGVVVDGNDVLAVYAATRDAVARAKKNEGPTLIEAITFRQGPHTTSDDPRKYRSKEEEAYWLDRDPLKRVRLYLEKNGLWDERKEKELLDECDHQTEDAVRVLENTPYDPESIFLHQFAEMTPELEEQFAEFKQRLARQ